MKTEKEMNKLKEKFIEKRTEGTHIMDYPLRV